VERRRIREVLERYRSAAQRAVACVSTGTINIQQPSGSRPDEFMLALNNREPAAITRDLLLQVYFVVDVAVGRGRGDRDFSSSIVGYSYTVLHQPNIEVVAYHWHPESAEGSADPHVHFGPASSRPDSAVRPGDLHKVHFPTGFVSLEKFAWLLIDEFNVEPRRSDWRDILSQRS
jgi:hypothetical protein